MTPKTPGRNKSKIFFRDKEIPERQGIIMMTANNTINGNFRFECKESQKGLIFKFYKTTRFEKGIRATDKVLVRIPWDKVDAAKRFFMNHTGSIETFETEASYQYEWYGYSSKDDKPETSTLHTEKSGKMQVTVQLINPVLGDNLIVINPKECVKENSDLTLHPVVLSRSMFKHDAACKKALCQIEQIQEYLEMAR